MILSVFLAATCGCSKYKENNDILFWNVDTQNDFIQADGLLSIAEAEAIKPTLAKITQFAKKRNIRVVNTCDYHNENSAELSDNPDFINTFPPHCMQNTKGQEFITETTPENPLIFNWNETPSLTRRDVAFDKGRNIVIRKDLFDVFAGNPNTEKILELLAPKKVFVYGVATNVCVDFAVMGLLKRNYKVYVIEDAIKELPKIPSPVNTWKAAGAKFISSAEIEKHL